MKPSIGLQADRGGRRIGKQARGATPVAAAFVVEGEQHRHPRLPRGLTRARLDLAEGLFGLRSIAGLQEICRMSELRVEIRRDGNGDDVGKETDCRGEEKS